MPGVVTDIYRVAFEDVAVKGHLMLKAPLKVIRRFSEGDCYIADKIKLVLTPKREFVLISTTLTVLTLESDEDIDSLELSQKQHDIIDFNNNYECKMLDLSAFCPEASEVPVLSSSKQIEQRANAQFAEWTQG